MERLKNNWRRTPRHIRKPVVLFVGVFFVLLSGTVGWLPGPGGIPIFILGIAILASEFAWAERLRDKIMQLVHRSGHWMRSHPIPAAIIILLGLSISVTIMLKLFYS